MFDTFHIHIRKGPVTLDDESLRVHNVSLRIVATLRTHKYTEQYTPKRIKIVEETEKFIHLAYE